MSKPGPDPDALPGDQALALALELHKAGRFAEAEAAYASVLRRFPDHPDALHFCGLMLCQRADELASPESTRDMARGKRMMERAVEVAPDYADAHNNLGNVYIQTGELEKGERSLRAALALRPDFAHANNNLGVLLKQLGRASEAVEFLAKATELDPTDGRAFHLLGEALRRSDRLEEAVFAYRKAIAISPNGASFRDLTRTLRQLGDKIGATESFDAWLGLEPENPEAIHMRAALTGADVPGRASDAYVTHTFDGFAPTFDEVLGRVGYRGPELVADAVRAVVAGRAPGGRFEVLDGGCGTGLCGPLTRPFAARLVGVDLSPEMLERARARGVYDELVNEELTAYLRRSPSHFDAIVSADTLVYFGDLTELMDAAAKALRDAGCFIFTVEHLAPDPGSGYRLGAHGRYSHSQSYVERVASAAGLSIEKMELATVRMEHGAPVVALVVTARADSEQRSADLLAKTAS